MWATSSATREHSSIPIRAPLRLIAEHPGGVGIEDAAAGEAHDVVEKAQGAVQGTVLVVDAGVDVADVGLVDQLGGRLIVVG